MTNITITIPPLPGSPALDPVGGDVSSVFFTKQRGAFRAVGGIVDVSAVEFQGDSLECTVPWVLLRRRA